MEDILNETIALAKKTINEKNPKLKNKDEVARQVAVGAIFFGDLMNDRNKDIVFDIQRILDFEGDTGPYLQYTYARASSILRKAKAEKLNVSAKVKFDALNTPQELKLITLLSEYPQKITDALKQYRPHTVAQHLIQAGRAFNEFYHACPVMQEKDKEKQKARLLLIDCARTVLRNGLGLLGISAPEEM
jgi:arginyl-tRNA synthetase